ncbi:MAG TPA: PAS domain-containing sensor histidine kinase [Longimicrobiaceae bacterium]
MPMFSPLDPPPRPALTGDVVSTIFPGSGPMATMCRTMNWAETPLGPPEGWPQSLRTAAGMVVAQGIAQALCWGPDLLQIYNDAYRIVLGDKHPGALGRPVLESWSEIVGDISPLFERVMGGETVFFEDLGLKVIRYGQLQDAYFTFSYSPVRVESGEVGAVLVNFFETTRQVAARALQRERDSLLGQLQVERARLEAIFQHAPAFLAVLRGADHTFELVNDSYRQLVGNRPVVGMTIREALPEVVDQGFVELLDQVMESGRTFVGRETPVSLAQESGEVEQRYLNFVYLPLDEADRGRTGVIVHGTDVTEQVTARREVERLLIESERAREDAEAARAEAEAANRAKADFLASMSHELRTPLNAIGGYAELLEMEVHGPITAAQRGALDRIAASQRHLLTLINDLLAFARVEAGRIELEIRPLAPRDVLAGVEPLVAPIAATKRIEFSTEWECERNLLADEERLRQILVNVVGNGIKFTAPGGWVRMSCRASGETVEIRVSDNGPGIAAAMQRAIFDPFTQVNRRLSHPREGVGLGLAISRDLARAMGGEIMVESEEGKGSTFTIMLPAAAPVAIA